MLKSDPHNECPKKFVIVIGTARDTKVFRAGYTATPVACGWAGSIFRSLDHLGRSSVAKNHKNSKKVKCDRRTDKRTKRGVESTKNQVFGLVIV